MPNAVTAIFGADSTPMSAEFAKSEVIVRRFGKTLADVNAADNAQMMANSAALKQLISERAQAKDELARYNAWLERNNSGTAASRAAIAAENEELLRKSAILRGLNAEALRNRGVSGDLMMVGSAADTAHVKQMAYLRQKAAIMGAGGSGMAPGFAKLVAAEAAGAAIPAAGSFWKKFVTSLQGHGSGGIAQLVHVFRATFDSLISGMNPTRVLLQQGPQAFQAISTMGGTVAKVFMRALGILFSIPGAIAAIGAAVAFFTFNHLRRLNDVLDRTGKAAESSFGDMAKSHTEAMKDAARAASDLEYNLNKLGLSYRDLTESTQLSLAKMREEFQLMREVARLKGASKRSELKAEQEQRKKELELIETNMKQAVLQKLAAKREIEDAADAAQTSQEAIARNAKLKDIPKEITDTDEELKKFKAYQKELQDKSDNVATTTTMAGPDGMPITIPLSPEEIKASRDRQANTTVSVGEKGNEEQHSLNEVNNRVRLLEAAKLSLPQEQAKLEKVQRDLDNAQKEAQLRGERSSQAVEQLAKERDALKSSIELHEKYDPKLGRSGERGSGGGSGLNAQQRIGAYAAVPPDMKIQTDLLRKIAEHTAGFAKSPRGITTQPVRFGGATHH